MQPSRLLAAAFLLAGLGLSARAAETPGARPNIVVIMADDLGYADVGFQGAAEYRTPHLDALARAGVRCTDGYVSHPFCSPTRAGFLTGRYQQRFGHENNPTFLPDDTRVGLPVEETTIADALRGAGYATGLVGKWHLGAAPPFHPNRRGFDEFFGFLGGGHDYFKAAAPGQPAREYSVPIERNGQAVPMDGYLTDTLSAEAASFVRRHRERPFFLFLSYNAPHTPYQAPPAHRERFPQIEADDRRTYAAMIAAVDDGVGRLTAALRETGLEGRTLVFFLSDNGGQTMFNTSSNAPLRGRKGTVYEGGIRVPFLASWPGRIPAGATCSAPVSSLDILPTAAALAGARLPAGRRPDGIDILPVLTRPERSAPERTLYWRAGGGTKWAVRRGTMKLAFEAGKAELFDLQADPAEKTDRAAQSPGIAGELERAYRAWSAGLVPPRWESPRPGRPAPAKPGGS